MTQLELSTTIRAAGPEDAWAVHRLFDALHSHNATLDPRFALADGWPLLLDAHLARVWAASGGLAVLAWQAAAPVGLLMMDGHTDSPLFRHRRWAELLALYVAPEAQGAGVGEALLDEGLVWAARCGFDRVQLYVTASNAPARRFYTRAGFRPVQEIWRCDLELDGDSLPDSRSCGKVLGQHPLTIQLHGLGTGDVV